MTQNWLAQRPKGHYSITEVLDKCQVFEREPQYVRRVLTTKVTKIFNKHDLSMHLADQLTNGNQELELHISSSVSDRQPIRSGSHFQKINGRQNFSKQSGTVLYRMP